MIFLTHVIGGIVLAAYLNSYFGIYPDDPGKIFFILTAMIFSILPDIDMVNSKAGRKLQPFSTVFSFFFKHRGILHGIPFAAIVYFGVRYLSTQAIATTAVIGYSSHLALDSITKEGVTPLSPFLKFKLKGFVRTGSLFEKLILVILAILLLIRLP